MADPQSLPVVITIFVRVVCTYVLSSVRSFSTFQNLAKQNEVQVRMVIAIGGTVGLGEWIIDDTHVWYHTCAGSDRPGGG